jgi:serine/threonine-protein kinase
VGGFVLLQPLGAGGISSVYKGCAASDPETPLAIKILQPDRVDDPEAIAAFALERNIHAHVPRHPNVVGFVASGEEEGEPYYAMEFVPGVRVEKWVQESGGLDEESALGVTAQLLAALRHILAAGFLYRDVNAGNLILKDNGEVVLIDFGLALPLDYDYVTNASRHVWGTGPFMPPERIRRAPEDERSVVYSVGMLLFFLLSGRTFFEEEELVEQARRHLSPIRLAVTGDILPGRSPQGAELVGQTIRARPEDRIQTLAELEERVLALLPEE